MNTRYLAKEFGVPLGELHDRLATLVDEGVLEHAEVGDRLHLWWLSPEAELDE